ncbi:thiamine pyrophosphate-binding protein [Paraburkholderia acidiphila]|uniref:Thiamine pyrophosphate-binding protein n=1 Tax=Paraburkholderia acidiphila TaxID=2571747 RepID=A0A7Z2JAR7_9BURK|nr:thiamine pyrophosphate-binding protein [Paraburkholderia acidiphila]QGZ57726.1 thiamine pyrophosphate-binding protein [Paraburkholderia acidiphila]
MAAPVRVLFAAPQFTTAKRHRMTVALTPNPPGGPSASALWSALRDAGTSHVVTVPDFVQFALHDKLRNAGEGMQQIFACSEDQALTTATGLYIGGASPVLMMQNQGFYKCLNTLRATCIDASVPMVFLVGQFGREIENFGAPARRSRRSVVWMIEPLLEAIGVRYWNVDEDEHVKRCAEAFAHAKATEGPAVVLIGRHVTWN